MRWKTPIFCAREVQKIPNASHLHPLHAKLGEGERELLLQLRGGHCLGQADGPNAAAVGRVGWRDTRHAREEACAPSLCRPPHGNFRRRGVRAVELLALAPDWPRPWKCFCGDACLFKGRRNICQCLAAMNHGGAGA
jgi:hypothetical protein